MKAYQKNAEKQTKIQTKFKGFLQEDNFKGEMSPSEFRFFMQSHSNKKLLHYTIYVFARFNWGCENVRPSRKTILDTINDIFCTNYTSVNELSRVTKLMKKHDLIKKGQHMFGYNRFGTNSYLLAQNLLTVEYLIVLRDFIPYNRELELMIARESFWNESLKEEIARRKQRLNDERTLSNINEFIYRDYLKKETKISNLHDREVGLPFEGEIRPEILSQDSQFLGARPPFAGMAAQDCCSMCSVLGERLCVSVAKPGPTKGKADATPASRSRVPAESSQVINKQLRTARQLSPDVATKRSLVSYSPAKLGSKRSEDQRGLSQVNRARYFPLLERVKFTRERKEYWEEHKPSTKEEELRRKEKALKYQRILGIS